MKLRPSRRGEEDALGAVAHDAFRVNDASSWQRYFHENTARAPEDTLVAEDETGILGHATALRLSLKRRGREVPFRGVAAVAVTPLARRQGVAGRLVRALLQRMRRRGEALSLLYPFSTSYYQGHGYGLVEWVDLLRVAPRQLPASPLRSKVRRLDLPRDLGELRRVYEAARTWSSGLLARDAWWWDARVTGRAPDRVGFWEGRLEGYLLYEVPREPAALGRQHVVVKELVALTPDAWRGLVGYLEALGEQIGVVELTLPRGTGAPLVAAPPMVGGPDTGLYHATLVQASGAMARVVDVGAAMALLARGKVARVGLDIEDPVFGPTTHEPRSRSRLRLSTDLLAQIAFSAASARLLLARGQISGSVDAAKALDEALEGEPLFLGRLNFF
jgi:predicted acetyltransferase